MTRKETCQTCRWWNNPEEKYESGSCHARPPVLFPNDAHGYWPRTFKDAFCAAYRETEAKSLLRKAKLRELGETE